MARSMFNASLALPAGAGAQRIAVKLYSAVEPRPVRFHLLHAADATPIRQRLVHPETGEEVPREAVRRGVVRPGGMVVLREDELAALRPPPSRTIELLRLLPPDRLDHRWYARPYYLGPADEDPSAYFAFARALADAGREGIVRWTMRNKRYRGALRSQDGYLVLIRLRAAAQIVASAALPERVWPTPSPQELAMARQLVEMLAARGQWAQLWPSYRDRYSEQLVALTEAKAAGRAPSLAEPRPRATAEPSLAAALAASIAKLEQERDVA